MSSINILQTEILANQNSRLEKITYQRSGESGDSTEHVREVFHRPNATAILLYDPVRKTILLTEQDRLPVYLREKPNSKVLEVCAGLIDDGEFPEHTVVREVEEETGYRISHIQKVGEAYSSPGAFSEYIYYFIGEYSPDLKVTEGGGLEQEGEDIKQVELSFAQARQLLSQAKIHDAKTLVLLQYALINGII